MPGCFITMSMVYLKQAFDYMGHNITYRQPYLLGCCPLFRISSQIAVKGLSIRLSYHTRTTSPEECHKVRNLAQLLSYDQREFQTCTYLC